MNALFQWLWFFWFRRKYEWSPDGLEKQGDPTMYLETLIPAMIGELETARRFGQLDTVILGDSNGEAWDSFKVMRKFKKITVNLAKGGTTVQDWERLLKSKDWPRVRNLIGGSKVIINIGGNCALKKQMTGVRKGYEAIKSAFPKAYLIKVPPTWAEVADPEIKKRMITVNRFADEVFGKRALDPSALVDMNADGLPDIGALQDAVHYSKATLKLMRPIIEALP